MLTHIHSLNQNQWVTSDYRFGMGYLLDGFHPEVDSISISINHLAHKYVQSEVLTPLYRGEVQRVNHLLNRKADQSLGNFF